jgi:hypothetical protein
MTKTEIRNWLIQEFQPLTLATDNTTIDQIVDNAIRYWNTHSAYKIIRMLEVSDVVGDQMLEVPIDIKTVANCYPSVLRQNLLSDHPMWVLLNFVTLNMYSRDLMQVEHAYNGYKIYLGEDFRWKFLRSEDPAVKGSLFLQKIPRDSSRVAVVGAKRIVDGEDIKSEHILDWILYYAKALLRITEGNTLRKAGTIGVTNDGNELVNEGKDEIVNLQTRLKEEGRWLLFAKRG